MIRLGIIDFDSSHCVEFTQRFNRVGVSAEQFVNGAKVVVGCAGTSEMAPERIPGFRKQVADCGVDLVDRPEDVLGQVDAVLILSLSGGAHWERARPFLEAGVPTFVDKPFACSLADAEDMIRLARQKNVWLFSSSALRFVDAVSEFEQQKRDVGDVRGVLTYGPAKRADGNPGLFHYGIHAVELLFTLMGSGCREVTTMWTEGAEVVTGHWDDGRVATLRGNRLGSTAYGFLGFCEQAVVHKAVSVRFSYRNLCQAIVDGLNAQKPPVDPETTLEIVRFVLAARESERLGGQRVELGSIDRTNGETKHRSRE